MSESDTKPSAEKSFIFGVDLDSVCADYVFAFRRIVAEVKGINPDTLTLDPSWNFSEWGISGRDEFLELHDMAVTKRRIFATMPAIDGCAEVLWKLSDNSIWIRIITHRLQVKGDHAIAVSDTVTWLDAHNVPYRDICFLGAKPQVEADLYVDDGADNISSLRAAGNQVIAFDRVYNRHLDGLRVERWDQVYDIVMAAADRHTAAAV
jgi:5'-nucleotidase